MLFSAFYLRAYNDNNNRNKVRRLGIEHEDLTTWKRFPLNSAFVRWIHLSPVNSSYKGQEMRSFDDLFDYGLNKLLMVWGAIVLVWHHCNVYIKPMEVFFKANPTFGEKLKAWIMIWAL